MRTVVALFDRFEDAQQAVRALNEQGFPNNEINLVASDERGEYSRQIGTTGETTTEETDGAAAGAGIGAVLGGIGGLLLGLGALAIPGIGPVIAAGPIVATLAGAGIGAVAGGLIGALVDLGIPEEHAEYYAEGIRRGGTLVTVRTDDMRAEDARSLLNRFNPVDIDTRAATWRDEGWTGFRQDDTSMEYDRDRSTSMPVTGMDVDDDYGTTPTTGMGSGMGTGTVAGTDWDTSTSYDRDVNKMDDHDIDRMDDHLRDDVFGTERAGRDIDVPVTGGGISGTTGTAGNYGMGSTGLAGDDWDMYDQSFRSDYQVRYGRTGFDYDYYQPAYRYGYDLSREERYRGYDWDRLESEARLDWERRGIGGAWDDVKDAVRHAWERVTR